ncbi:uncharacterized protein sS8_2966 [Methylocaldum marinum]|uniref:Lipoprotein n=1 Tax=Methylocaldum marinum TaxID=1432792 RepID=A0A250KYP3_9GAMM|nr:hypothetical protein [Methylocaldum marinum]BBA34909.1 uncharacterized protein sS8_2966 [Methylocaldum marinum]
MMKGTRKTLLAAGLLLSAAHSSVWAIGGVESFKIDQFCDVKSARQTLVYVDDQMLVKGEIQWAKQLIAKLSANLVPSEPVTLVKLATESGTAQELWKACFPDYPPGELAKKQQAGGWLDKITKADPAKQLKEQQAIFRGQMGGALEKLLAESDREFVGTPEKKQVVRALENDLARFDTRDGMIRVVVYSDLLEKSDLIDSAGAKPEAARKLADTRKLNFQNAVFHVFGTGQSDSGADDLKSFWEAFFESGSGSLADFGSELVLSSKAPGAFKTYEVEIALSKDDVRRGKLLMFVEGDGKLQDSILTVGTKQRSLVDDGEFLCQQKSCSLQGKARSPLIVAEGKEEFSLSGSPDQMTGEIQIPGAKLGDGKDAAFAMSVKLSK